MNDEADGKTQEETQRPPVMHSKVAMQCGPATSGTSHNVWDVVLYNQKGRATSSRIS